MRYLIAASLLLASCSPIIKSSHFAGPLGEAMVDVDCTNGTWGDCYNEARRLCVGGDWAVVDKQGQLVSFYRFSSGAGVGGQTTSKYLMARCISPQEADRLRAQDLATDGGR